MNRAKSVLFFFLASVWLHGPQVLANCIDALKSERSGTPVVELDVFARFALETRFEGNWGGAGKEIYLPYLQNEVLAFYRLEPSAVTVVDVRSGKVLREIALNEEERFVSSVLNPEGTKVALTTSAGLRIEDVSNLSAPPSLVSVALDLRREAPAPVIQWSPDGSRFAVLSDGDHAISVFKDNGDHVRTWDRIFGKYSDFAWSPDGTRLAAVDGLKTITIYSLMGGETRTLEDLAGTQALRIVWPASEIVTNNVGGGYSTWDAASGTRIRGKAGDLPWLSLRKFKPIIGFFKGDTLSNAVTGENVITLAPGGFKFVYLSREGSLVVVRTSGVVQRVPLSEQQRRALVGWFR